MSRIFSAYSCAFSPWPVPTHPRPKSADPTARRLRATNWTLAEKAVRVFHNFSRPPLRQPRRYSHPEKRKRHGRPLPTTWNRPSPVVIVLRATSRASLVEHVLPFLACFGLHQKCRNEESPPATPTHSTIGSKWQANMHRVPNGAGSSCGCLNLIVLNC